jgi:hypothetical protein
MGIIGNLQKFGVGVDRGFRVLKNRVPTGSDKLCRPSQLGELCCREIDVLHHGPSRRNDQPPPAIRHVAQSVGNGDSEANGLSGNYDIFVQMTLQMDPE